MNKFYFYLHTVISNFKETFLSTCLLFFLMLQINSSTTAQCININSSGIVTAPSPGNTVQINSCAFAGDYSTINSVTASTSYTINSSINTDVFTVTQGTPGGSVIAFGVTPLTWTSTTAGTYYVHINSNSSCGTQASCRTTNIANNGTCVPPVVTVTPNNTCGGVVNSANCVPLTAGGADTYTWFPFTGLYINCTHTAPYTGQNTPLVYAAPVVNTIYTVTGKITATGCTNTATATVNSTPPAPLVTPASVNMCLGDPPVKLKVTSGLPTTTQFCSGPVNIPVPDNDPAGVSNSVTVAGIPGSCTITGMSVTINMTHTKVGNMVFVLKAPNGQVINLDYHLSATGGSGTTSGFVNTVISTSGIAYLHTGTDPYTGVFRADLQSPFPSGGYGPGGPTGMLPTVTVWPALYTTLNGTWTLGMYDGVSSDIGTLTSWCLNISYSCGGVPGTTPAIWSPTAGLFSDPAATVPYVAGLAIDSVWTRPTPAGVYPYQVITQGLPPTLCNPVTNFVSNSGDATVTFNVRNNHPFPIRLLQIDSRTLNPGSTVVLAYYKTSPINGPPGIIAASNGWIQFGGTVITGNGLAVQPFFTTLSLVIPPGATYGICLQAASTLGIPNLAFSTLSPGNYSFNDGGCEIITGSNIGYSGAGIPAAPTTTPSGFVGSLHFTAASPVCTSPPRTVVVTVGQQTTVTTQPADQNICIGNNAIFSVVATGGGPFNYQWQVSSNGGVSYTNIANAGVYNGVNTATLTITTPPLTMSGYRYRVNISGTSSCASVSSSPALLTVNPLPVVVITANPLIITPVTTTTIFSTVTPNPAATYTWFYNGSVLPGATADTLLVDINGLGDYQLSVTDVNGCSGLSNIITITDQFAPNLFVYPNPSGGKFQVRYHSEANNAVSRSLLVYNNRGEKVITKSFVQTIPYERVDLDIRANGKGLYWIILVDQNGKRLAVNTVMVQ